MRKIVAIAMVSVAFGSVAALDVRADDRESPAAVVEKAIKAHGGEEALNKARSLSRTGEGVMSLSGNTPFTEETIMALPGRVRITVDLNKSQRLTLIVNDDKAWQIVGGAVLDVAKERIEEAREEAYVMWLCTLTPLLKSNYTLTSIPDSVVGGSPALGVKVVCEGHYDAKLYFDKQSYLLVKLERHARESGVELTKTYIFSDYKDVDGVKLPIHEVQLIAGKKFIERTSATYKLLSRTDDSAFTKP
jgi:hypothetical protein